MFPNFKILHRVEEKHLITAEVFSFVVGFFATNLEFSFVFSAPLPS
jgi:hypothetical protein